MYTILSGFGISISLIASIGAQNAFVLKQGLKKQHVFPIVLTYIVSDIILLSAGVFGFGIIMQQLPTLMFIIKWAGIVFLVSYGFKSLYTAITLTEGLNPKNIKTTSLQKSLLIFLALTWLNPQVYIDTVVLIGGISAQFAPNEIFFWFGAILASIIYACILGYGARLFSPLFAKTITWRILDSAIALIMWIIAIQLYYST